MHGSNLSRNQEILWTKNYPCIVAESTSWSRLLLSALKQFCYATYACKCFMQI